MHAQRARTHCIASQPVEIAHEPESTVCTTLGCGCALKRIGEDVSEKLDYTPGVFTVERHVRGKWVCSKCQTLTQAPVPAQHLNSKRFLSRVVKALKGQLATNVLTLLNISDDVF